MLTLRHNRVPVSHARHDCYHHFNVTTLMADAFGLFQLLSSGTSIFVYSDTLKDNSAGYKQSATVNLPNDIGAVVGLFSCRNSSTVSTASYVFKADNHTYTVYLSDNQQNMSNLKVDAKLAANYSQATITPSTGPTDIAILAW